MSAFGWFLRFGCLVAAGLVATHSTIAAQKEERWLRLSTPEFVVVTPLKEKEAVAWAGDFSQYVAALHSYFQRERRRLPHLQVVVFAREKDLDAYKPLDAAGRPQQMIAFFLQRGTWSVAGLSGATQPDEMRRTIFHEGLHWFLSGSEVPNPVWIEEGLAEVFSTFATNKGKAEWGKAIPEHVSLLRHQGLLPLERLLYTGRDELFGRDLTHTGIVYAQSWAVAHYLIFGQHTISRDALGRFAELTHAAISPDEAFRRAFGQTYQEMDRQLERYINAGAYFVSRRPLAEFVAPRVEVASPFEVENALGRLALAGRRWSRAIAHARAAIISGESDPRGHELLGMALSESGAHTEALVEFSRAVDLGSKDAQPYFELAMEEQRQAAGDSSDLSGLSPEAARRMANGYERAINLHPQFRVAYQNLAGIIGIAEPWSAQDRLFLEQGRKLWPRDEMIQVGLAILLRRGGDKAGARALLAAVLAGSTSDGREARAFGRRLDDGWEQQDVIEEINSLIEAQKFAEGVIAIEAHVARGVAAPLRTQLLRMLPSLQAGATAQKITLALREERWAEARRLLSAMISSDASVAEKEQAKRSLAELDRHKLGLEASAP